MRVLPFSRFLAVLLALVGLGLIAAGPAAATPSTPSQDGDGLCPAPNGKFPHEDYAKYWHCSNSQPLEKDCPASLHFDPKSGRCEWPGVACVDPDIPCSRNETGDTAPGLIDNLGNAIGGIVSGLVRPGPLR